MGKGRTDNWIIYGATGYTGRLITEEAVKKGLRPTLAGRNAAKVQKIASEFDLPWTAFSVDDTPAVLTALKDKYLLLSVAGPFAATASQLMNACIESGTHYLDVTGEIDVFELAASKDAAAKKAGITLLPGVGFDVVPSDCLAAHTAAHSKNPVSLKLAIKSLGPPSRGTAKTMVEALGRGTAVRRGGRISFVGPGSLLRDFDFGNGCEQYVAVSWGDIATAYHSTSIADIEVYFPYVGQVKSMTTASRILGGLMQKKILQAFMKKQVDKMPSGPDEESRCGTGSVLRAEVTDESGAVFISQLSTPNGYSLTAEAAVLCCIRLFEKHAETGFKTPSLAFGSNLLNDLSGCKLEDH